MYDYRKTTHTHTCVSIAGFVFDGLLSPLVEVVEVVVMVTLVQQA